MLVMLTFHTFGLSLSEILFADRLMHNLVPPIWFFAVSPLGVTFVTVDVVTVGLHRIVFYSELLWHRLHKRCVILGVFFVMVLVHKGTYLIQTVQSSVIFVIPLPVLVRHAKGMFQQPMYIRRIFIQPFGTRVMGKPFYTVVGPVGFLGVNAMCIKCPRSQQLKRLCRHFDYKFIWQIASGKEWVVVYSEYVHGGLEQVVLV